MANIPASMSGTLALFFYDLCYGLIRRPWRFQETLCFFASEQIQNKEVEGADRGKHLAEMQV